MKGVEGDRTSRSPGRREAYTAQEVGAEEHGVPGGVGRGPGGTLDVGRCLEEGRDDGRSPPPDVGDHAPIEERALRASRRP